MAIQRQRLEEWAVLPACLNPPPLKPALGGASYGPPPRGGGASSYRGSEQCDQPPPPPPMDKALWKRSPSRSDTGPRCHGYGAPLSPCVHTPCPPLPVDAPYGTAVRSFAQLSQLRRAARCKYGSLQQGPSRSSLPASAFPGTSLPSSLGAAAGLSHAEARDFIVYLFFSGFISSPRYGYAQ